MANDVTCFVEKELKLADPKNFKKSDILQTSTTRFFLNHIF